MRSRLAAAVLATIMLSGCGQGSTTPNPASSSSPSQGQGQSGQPTLAPAALLERATRNTLAAPSKHLRLQSEIAGGEQSSEIDFVGDLARGTQASAAPGFNSIVEFVRVGGDLYIFASELYWQWYVPLQTRVDVSDKWVRVDADHASHSALLVLTDRTGQPEGTITQTGTDSVEGEPVVLLTDSAGNEFAVTQGPEPYLVRMKATQPSDVGPVTVTIVFSRIGEVQATISAPPGPIFDLESLPVG